MKEYRLSSDTLWNELHEDFKESGGAYILFSKKNGKIVQIDRFLGKDTEGVLYIGKATSYIIRVIDLKKTLDPSYKSNPHIGGRRYYLNRRIQEVFPYVNLYVSLYGHPNPSQKEKALLEEYFQKFGEVPPLNAV